MLRRLIILLLIVGCEGILLEPEDCAGVAGGTAVLDDCGICTGITNYVAGSCYDCAGVAFGTAEFDNCDVCDTDRTNDCVSDCAGEWGGESVDDCDGVCNGGAVVLWGICYPTSTTSINLSGSGLTGEIPVEIGNLQI